MNLYVFLTAIAISLGMCQPVLCSDTTELFEEGRSNKNNGKVIELESFPTSGRKAMTDQEFYKNILKYIPTDIVLTFSKLCEKK